MPNNSLSVLDINLCNLVENYNIIKDAISPSSVSAVVKANAYGLGAVPISKALYEAGCREFYVFSIDEALEIREELQDVIIYALQGMNKGEGYYFLEHKIIPVLNNIEQLKLWHDLANTLDTKLPANLFFDTHMYRLGFSKEDHQQIQEYLSSSCLDILYISSHLSCADTPNHSQNQKQLQAFSEIVAEFPDYKTSLSSSESIWLGKEFNKFDQARIGIDLYALGCNSNSRSTKLKPVVEMHSEIIQVRRIKEDGYVGYGATAKVHPGMKIAVIPVGYADAYYFRQAKDFPVFIDGYEARAIGAASMDLITLDVSKIPDEKLFIGQKVEIFGKNISIETISKMSNTLKYGILTSLGSRFKRNYVE